ncbi:hypothetical protein Esti_001757 [Eimeria stiedai]
METPSGAPHGKHEEETLSLQQARDHPGTETNEEPLPLAADLAGPEEATKQQQQQGEQRQEQQEKQAQQEQGEERQGWPKHQQQQQQQAGQHHQQGRQQQQHVLPAVAQGQPSAGEVEALTQQLLLLKKLIEEGRGTSDMQQLLAAASAAAAPPPSASNNSSSSSTADGVHLAHPRLLPAPLDGATGPSGSSAPPDRIAQEQQHQQALVLHDAAPHMQPVGSCSVSGEPLGRGDAPLVLQGPESTWPFGRQSHSSPWRAPARAPPGLEGLVEGEVSYPGGLPYRAPLLSNSRSRSFSFGGRGAVMPQGGGPVLYQGHLQLVSPSELSSPLQAEEGVLGSAFAHVGRGPLREKGGLLPVGGPLMGPPALLHLGPPRSDACALASHPKEHRALGVGPPPPSLDSLEALLSRQQQQQQRRGPRGPGGAGASGAQPVVQQRRSPPRVKSVYFFCPSCLEAFPASSLSLFAAHISQKGHVVQQLQRLRGPDSYYRCPKCTCKGSDILGLLRHWQEGGAAHHGQKILKHIRAREPPVKPSQPIAVPTIPGVQQQHLALLQQQQEQQMLPLQEAGVVGAHPLQGGSRSQGPRGGESEVSLPRHPLYLVGPHRLRPQEAPQSEGGPSMSHRGGSFPPHIAQDGWRGAPLLRDMGGPPKQPSVGPFGVDFRSGSTSQKSSGLSDETSDESLLQTQQQQQREEVLRCLMGLHLSASGTREGTGVSGAGPRSSSSLTEETTKTEPFRRGVLGPPAPYFFEPWLPGRHHLASGEDIFPPLAAGASCDLEDGREAPARGPTAKGGLWGTLQQPAHDHSREMIEPQPLQQQQPGGVSNMPAHFLGVKGVSSALQHPAADRSNGPSALEPPFVWARTVSVESAARASPLPLPAVPCRLGLNGNVLPLPFCGAAAQQRQQTPQQEQQKRLQLLQLLLRLLLLRRLLLLQLQKSPLSGSQGPTTFCSPPCSPDQQQPSPVPAVLGASCRAADPSCILPCTRGCPPRCLWEQELLPD